MSPVSRTRDGARAASLRRLHGLVRSVNGDLDLGRTLDAVCRGLVEGLGFGVAVVNLVMADGALEVVACEGSSEAGAALLGQRAAPEVWDAWISDCQVVGDLLVDYRLADFDDDVPTWLPDLPVPDREGAWHPQDALLAPLRTQRSGLLGVISVDLPEDGLRPGADQLELLEMYAAQASVAIENAQLHSALMARDQARERALGRLTAVVGNAPVGIVELDLEGRVQLWNDAAELMFGWTAEEVVGSRNPVAPDDEYEARLTSLRRDGTVHRTATSRRRRDGTRLEVEMTTSVLADEADRPYGYLGVYVDVTHRRHLEEELRTAAFTDALTGLANRAHFTGRLETAGPDAHVVLLDLDGFKAVNDTLGHAAGDRVLVEVAQRLRSVVRDEDLVARLGGDEFVVLLSAARQEAGGTSLAETLSQRLVEVLAEPFALGERRVTLGASVGIAHVAGRAAGARDALLRDADLAMYAAKAAGKGRVRVFEPALRDAVVERVGLVGDLRAALAADELFLHWQPVVAVPTGRVRALEALPHWQHPQRGELPPAALTGPAEQAGLALPLAAHVLTRACDAVRRWQDLPGVDPGLSAVVDLSPAQVQADGLVGAVRDVLHDSGLAPSSLVLQVAGRSLGGVERVAPVLHELRSLGVRLSVDHFGADGSSLAQLRHLPLYAVTLDPTLLADARADGAGLTLLDAVVALTGRLGVLAVAAGVGSEVQWELLRRLGCPLGKATEPLTATDVPAALR